VQEEPKLKDNYYPVLIGLLLIVGILIIYWPVQHFEFINYDDNIYVTENVHVRSGITKESAIWAFTTYHAYNWHPLTWLSLMLDNELYQLNPGGYHWTNVLFHIANTLFLFLALNRMTGAIWLSGFVAALFALHPLHVESVAWVAERKDVFSTLFWMLTMYIYVFYIERPSAWRYALLLVCFSFGLMAKPMLVTLPFVLLLLDFWPLGRFPFSPEDSHSYFQKNEVWDHRISLRSNTLYRLTLEKIPLLILSILCSITTLLAQQSGEAVATLQRLSFMERVANAFISYSNYILKMFWPTALAVFYPYPGTWPVWQVAGSFSLLVAITALVIRGMRRHPYLAVGWLWYLGTLIPVIGLIQVGSQAMADRYTYIPLIGLFIMIAWGVPDILGQWRHKRNILLILSGFVLISLMICSCIQVQSWENGISLFQHAVNSTKNNSITYNNLGTALLLKNRSDEALIQYHKSIQLQPNNPDVYNNLGYILSLKGKANEAIIQYNKALQLKPRFAEAHFNIASAYSELGNFKEAAFHYSEAIRIKPDYAEAYNRLGFVYARQGNFDKAILNFQKALIIFPNYDAAYHNLRMAIQQKEAAYPTSDKK